MRYGFVVAACAVVVAAGLPARAPADAIDDALEILNQRHIAFTVAEFVDCVERNDFENVRVFLQAGMDPNTPKNGVPLLIEISMRGYEDTVKELLTGGASPNVRNDRGWTPLHMAVFFSHLKVAEILLEHKANVSPETEFGMTPLHYATQERNVEMVELLLKRGASPNIRSKSGVTALSIASDLGEKPIVKIYEAHGFGPRMKAIREERAAQEAAVKKEIRRKAGERDAQFAERMKNATGQGPQ